MSQWRGWDHSCSGSKVWGHLKCHKVPFCVILLLFCWFWTDVLQQWLPAGNARLLCSETASSYRQLPSLWVAEAPRARSQAELCQAGHASCSWVMSVPGQSLPKGSPTPLQIHDPMHQGIRCSQLAQTYQLRVVVWWCPGRRGKSACGSRFADCGHLRQVYLRVLREVWLIVSNNEFIWWVLFSIKHSKGLWLRFWLLFKLFWAFLPLHSITFICLFRWGRSLCSLLCKCLRDAVMTACIKFAHLWEGQVWEKC